MDCSISADLQRQLVDYIANYIDTNKDFIDNDRTKDLISNMMRDLYEAIEKVDKTPNFYHINTVSMIPFLIQNNFLKTSKKYPNPLKEKYSDILTKYKDVLNDYTPRLEDKTTWRVAFFNIINRTPQTTGGTFEQHQLDYLRIQGVKSNRYQKIETKDFNGDVVVLSPTGTQLCTAKVIKKNKKEIPTIDGIEVNINNANSIPQIEAFDVDMNEIGWFDNKQITDGVCQVHFEAFDFYANYAGKPSNELITGENENFQFYLNLFVSSFYEPINKVGYIKHTTTLDGKRVTEATDVEKTIIDAYLKSGGNLFLKVKDGKATFFTPKNIYNTTKSLKTEEKKSVVEKPKIESEMSYMTIPTYIRRRLISESQKKKGIPEPTNRAKKNLELNDAFVTAYNQSIPGQMTIGDTKVYLVASIGENATNLQKPPLILTACDLNGNTLKFKNEKGKLSIDETGDQVVFDMFPEAFMAFNNLSESEQNETFESIKKDLKSDYSVTDEQAEFFAGKIRERFQNMRSLYDRVIRQEKVFLKPSNILTTEYDLWKDAVGISKQDAKKIQFVDGGFFLVKGGEKRIVECVYSQTDGTEHDQADDIENLFFGKMDFNTRRNIFKDCFNRKVVVHDNNKTYVFTIEEDTKNKVINIKKGDNILFTYSNTTDEAGTPKNLEQAGLDRFKDLIHKKKGSKNCVPLTVDFNKKGKIISTPFVDGEGNVQRMEFSELPWMTYEESKLQDPLFVLTEIEKPTSEEEVDSAEETKEEKQLTTEEKQKQIEDALIKASEEDAAFKTIIQKNLNDPVTQEEMKQAKEWYENSPLSKIVPAKEAFTMVHSIAVAKFKSTGITLMSGSDYTDVYHEAWHTFSQLFMTIDQKKELYELVKKNKGSFTDYAGHKVTFKNADYRQIEEYLAEEFRSYMLSGKTKQTGKIKEFFNKILNILRNLFGLNAKVKPEEYFEKLRVYDLSKFTADKSNIMFDELEKSIVTKSSESLSMREAYDIKELMNIYISQYLPLGYVYKSGNLPYANALHYALDETIKAYKDGKEFQGIVEAKLNEYAESKSLSDLEKDALSLMWKKVKGTRGNPTDFNYDNVSEFLTSKKRIINAYRFCKLRLMMRQIQIMNQLKNKSISKIERVRLESRLKTIEDAISNYGESSNKLGDNQYGVVKYHFDKFFGDLELIDDEVDLEDEDNPQFDGFNDNKCNAKSAEQRLEGNQALKFILSTIPSYSLQWNKETEKYEYVADKNDYGEHKLKEFKHVKNRLNVMLQGSVNVKEMYERLREDAYEFDNDGNIVSIHNPMTVILLKKLGDPDDFFDMSDDEIMRKTILWTQFFEVFSAPEVRLHETIMSLSTKKEYVKDENGQLVYDDDGRKQTKSKKVFTINCSEMNGPYWKMDDYYRRQFTKTGIVALTPDGYALDNDEIMKKYPKDLKTLSDKEKRKRLVNLIRDCGLDVSLDSKCIEELMYAFDNMDNFNPSSIYDLIMSKVAMNKAVYDPVNDFWKSYDYNEDNLKPIYETIKRISIRYTEGVNTEMVRNAEGSTMFMNQLNNSITILFNNLRVARDYNDVLKNPTTKHLDFRKYIATDEEYKGLPVFEINNNYNYNCAGSEVLKNLFCIDRSDYHTIHDSAYVKVNNEYHLIHNLEEFHPEKMTRSSYKLSLVNLSGIKVRNEGSTKAQSLFQSDKDTKALADMILMSSGEMELMRHADNGVSYAMCLHDDSGNYWFFDPLSQLEGDMSWYEEIEGQIHVPDEIIDTIIEGIEHEAERYLNLQRLRELAKDPEFKYDRNYLDNKENNRLGVFDDMLSTDAKRFILDIIKKLNFYDNVDLSSLKSNNAFRSSIDKYFTKNIKDNLEQFNESLNIISEENRKLFVDALFEKYPNHKSLKDTDDIEVKKKVMSAIYTYNNILYNIASIKTIYGDVMTFNHQKDEFTKRIKGMGSSGKIPNNDGFMTKTLLTMDKKSYFSRVYGTESNPLMDDLDKGTIRTAICSDINPISAYAESYKEISKNYGFVEEESNAQGLITFDAYRMMCMRLGKWSDVKESLFQKICNGEDIKPEDTVTFFSVLKLQFNGPLVTENAPLMAFHKYSLMPILPNMVKDKNLNDVHLHMMMEGISYLTFVSGSKEANISRADNERITSEIEKAKKQTGVSPYKNKYGDKIYEPESLVLKNRVSVKDGKIEILPRQLNKDMENPNFFTPNEIPIQYIKDQVEIHDSLDRDTIFGTQMRRHIGNNLWNGGYPVDIDTPEKRKKFDNSDEAEKRKLSPIYSKSQRYFNAVKRLTENAMENLQKQFGYSGVDKNGNKVNDLKEKKFFEYIRKELVKKNIPEFAIDSIDSLEQLQFSPYANEIEKIICSLINRNVIRQHIHGGMFVQVASTLFENTENPGFGTNDLQFYGKSDLDILSSVSTYQEYDKEHVKVANDGEIEPATIKLPLAGDFAKLLKAKHFDGNSIDNISRLNECLRNKQWVAENINSITVIACRIPTQGYNSIENLRIAEFLEPGCNNIVVCPSEVVIKSGSDYDIDKLTMITPHIKLINGQVYNPMADSLKKPDDTKELIKRRNIIYNQLKNDIPAKLNSIIEHNFGGEAYVEKARKYLERIQEIYDNIDKINDFKKENEEGYDLYKADDTNLAEFDSSITNEYNKLTEIFKEIISPEGFGTQWFDKGEGVSFAHSAKQYENYLNECDKIAKAHETELKYRMNQSKAGLENNIIQAMSDILKDPVVYNSLLKPNETSLFTGEGRPINDLVENSRYNRFENIQGDKYKDEKGKFQMSPTRVIEAPYNLDKHDNLKVGKVILGPTAIDGVFAPIAKNIGLKLSYTTMEEKDYYIDGKLVLSANEVKKMRTNKIDVYKKVKKIMEKEGIDPKENVDAKKLLSKIANFSIQKIHLRSNISQNKYGETVVDLSKARNLDNEEISEVLSQLLNGCVDVAKDAWISYINGNREAIPTLLFLVQAGVPVTDLSYYMANPLILEYIRRKTHKQSALDELTEQEYIKPELKIRGEMIQQLGYTMEMINQKNGKYLSSDTLTLNISKVQQAALSRNEGDFLTSNLEKLSKSKDPFNKKNGKLLLHFFQLEDMAQSVNSLKLSIRVDGSKANNVYDILSRQRALQRAKEDPRLDQDAVSKVDKTSIMSSFFIEKDVIDIIQTTMPIKADKDLNETFESYFSDMMFPQDRDVIYTRWFAEYPSYLYQYNKKVVSEDYSKIVDDVLNKGFIPKDDKGNDIGDIFDEPYISDTIKNAVGLELHRRLDGLKNLNDIYKSDVFQTWLKEYKGVDINDGSYNKYDKQAFVYKFLLYNSLQSVGDCNQLFGSESGFSTNSMSIASKFTIVLDLINSDRELSRLFSGYMFFNKIQIRNAVDGSVSLVFESEMDDDQKAVVYEEYNTFRNSDIFGETLKNSKLSEYDKQFISDFFAELPYFILCQDNMNPSSNSLNCMFDMSTELKNTYDEFLKMPQEDKDHIQTLYANDFHAKYTQGSYYSFDKEQNENVDVASDDEIEQIDNAEITEHEKPYVEDTISPVVYNNKEYTVGEEDGVQHIYNSAGKEVFKADAPNTGKDRNIILSLLAVKNNDAAEVVNRGETFYVFKDNTIISQKTGQEMKLIETDGRRQEILSQTQFKSNSDQNGGEDSALNPTKDEIIDSENNCVL